MNIDEKIFRKETILRYKDKIEALGFRSKLTSTNFLMSRLFIEILLLIMSFFIPKFGLLIGIGIVIIFHFLYEYILIDSNIKIRNDNLYDEALIFYRMLKLSLISTNDLSKSLELVSTKSNGNSFAYDFKTLLKKNNYNDNLNKVFKDMQTRMSNKDIIISLIDLSKSNDYITTLDNIINNLENKSKVVSKGKYSKLPFRLCVLSIFIISIFILLIVKLEFILQFFD